MERGIGVGASDYLSEKWLPMAGKKRCPKARERTRAREKHVQRGQRRREEKTSVGDTGPGE